MTMVLGIAQMLLLNFQGMLCIQKLKDTTAVRGEDDNETISLSYACFAVEMISWDRQRRDEHRDTPEQEHGTRQAKEPPQDYEPTQVQHFMSHININDY